MTQTKNDYGINVSHFARLPGIRDLRIYLKKENIKDEKLIKKLVMQTILPNINLPDYFNEDFLRSFEARLKSAVDFLLENPIKKV